jgi:hypothetical protein
MILRRALLDIGTGRQNSYIEMIDDESESTMSTFNHEAILTCDKMPVSGDCVVAGSHQGIVKRSL